MKGLLWAVLVAVLLAGAGTALAADSSPDALLADDLELARRYAPVLYFHPDELFRPQPAEVIVHQARLRQNRRLWFDVNVLLRLDVPDLLDLPTDDHYFLDVWFGDEGSSSGGNYTAQRAYYQALLSPEAGGPPIAIYAHVVRDEDPQHIAIQYWMLYFYNDWFNKHEGDWEMAEVILSAGGEPEWLILSQHHGGTRRPWSQVRVEEVTHPAVYVARGSHANYFVGDEVYLQGQTVGGVQIEMADRVGTSGRTLPQVILIPDRADVEADPMAWPEASWLPYRGRWGQTALQGDLGGPLGPADKGAQWETPVAWGLAQPLDTDVWYGNRLRVEVVDAAPDQAQVRLTDIAGAPLPAAEELGSLAILHAEPPAAGARATVCTAPDTRRDLVAVWPAAAVGRVTRMRFDQVLFGESGCVVLEFGSDGTANLLTRCIAGEGRSVSGCLSSQWPSQIKIAGARWDAPDVVWIGGVLPAGQIGLGVLVAVLGTVLPSSLYIGALYWVDRYEKEPTRLLAAAFVWGALPALLVVTAAEVFFRLPLDLLGYHTLEAVRLGLFAPLLEEAIKGAAVLMIYLHWRREFDDALDGVIYGAMVGFGFAMTSNLVRYLGNFALWGFAGLSAAAFVEGSIYATNQAVYTAIFGAGLGVARLARRRRARWSASLGAFALAVAAHALHNLLLRNLVGVNGIVIAATGAGVMWIAVVAVWTLTRERRCLEVELRGIVPDALYHTMITPGARARAEWQALRTGGIAAWRQTRRLHQSCAELAFERRRVRVTASPATPLPARSCGRKGSGRPPRRSSPPPSAPSAG